MSDPLPSVEQMCRDLLTRAVNDRLVRLRPRGRSRPHAQELSAGELIGVANLLSDYLRQAVLDDHAAAGSAQKP